jgi:branched-chain amino acid transport system ATP-binding protein
MRNDDVLVVREVTAGYGGPPIIVDVSLSLGMGEIAAIVGPNGAGKSTLMKAVVGLVKASGGSVRLDGVELRGMSPEQLVRHGLSYVPQVANVFPSLSVAENLRMGAYLKRRAWRERADEMAQMFPDLAAAWRRPARTLSGGQRTMLAIARLSPRMESVVWEHIVAVRDAGVGVLVVEQNTRRALLHADRGYVMVEGRNRLEGTGAELANDEEIADLYIGRA